MKERGQVAVVCLNNMWPWSGGMAQYLMWRGEGRAPYPMDPPHDWLAYQDYVLHFYSNSAALEDFRRRVNFVLHRKNSYTGSLYKDDPTIMAWEIANEPRGGRDPDGMLGFIDETARFIKSIDPNHVVTTGSEGTTGAPDVTGLHFVRDHRSTYVDYATIHFWAQNWGYFDPTKADETYAAAEARALAYVAEHVKKATALGKPVVLEEFGLARDGGSYDPASPTVLRDRYYATVMSDVGRRAAKGEPIAAVSFWAWAGEGRPTEPGGMWRSGTPFTGDLPHEPQGWYGVYDTDRSTLEVIAHAARGMQRRNAAGAED
jgi:mannan endo-1,4-beta-mannosidase